MQFHTSMQHGHGTATLTLTTGIIDRAAHSVNHEAWQPGEVSCIDLQRCTVTRLQQHRRPGTIVCALSLLELCCALCALAWQACMRVYKEQHSRSIGLRLLHGTWAYQTAIMPADADCVTRKRTS